MSFYTQFTTGPAKITTYTSGSGNYAPISTNRSFARVTVVGGGAGGAGAARNNTGAPGGGAGATQTAWIKLNEANYAYSVGAGGNGGAGSNSGYTAGNSGSKSYFGTVSAPGGKGPTQINVDTLGFGGGTTVVTAYHSNNASIGSSPSGIGSGGLGGEGSNNATPGKAPGFPIIPNSGFALVTPANVGYYGRSSAGTGVAGSYPGGGGGGDSLYGIGGNGGNGAAAGGGAGGASTVGYGGGGGGGGSATNAAGGAGGAGKGGIIIIEEFVQ